MEKIKTIWKDPVGSKVISVGVVGIIVWLFNLLLKWAIDIDFLNINIKLYWMFVLIFVILISFYIYSRYVDIKKEKSAKIDDTIEFKYNDATLKNDKELFDLIKNTYLNVDDISWVRSNNFGGFGYRLESIIPFNRIEEISRKVDFEFINPEIEIRKKKLFDCVNDFSIKLASNSFSVNNHNVYSIPSEWEITNPEKFFKVVDEVHELSRSIGANYDEFVRYAKRTLSV